CSLKRSTTFSGSNWSGKPTLNLGDGSERTLGNRKRTVPSSMATRAPVMANQARANQEPNRAKRKPRRSGLAGALAGGAGFGGSAGLAGGVAVTAPPSDGDVGGVGSDMALLMLPI